MLLMLVLGSVNVWGEETDYSGVYYIANNSSNNTRNYQGYDNASNYYLCPAHEYYDNGTIVTTLNYNNTPFLTTYQTRQTDESLWIVEKVENTNYYTFKQKFGDNGYRYLTVNDPITSLNKNHRRRVHLEQITEITDKNYFIIEPIETVNGINSYAICCLDKYKGGNYKYLNPPNGNSNQYTASNNDSGGIIGFYQKMNGSNIETGSEWFFEVPKPIIHIDGNNKLSLTCANEDVTIHYTIDGEDPSATGTEFVTVERGQYKLTSLHYKAFRDLVEHIKFHLLGHTTNKRIHNTIIKEICANSVEWSEADKSQWTLGAKFESDKVIIVALDLGKGILEKLNTSCSIKLTRTFF